MLNTESTKIQIDELSKNRKDCEICVGWDPKVREVGSPSPCWMGKHYPKGSVVSVSGRQSKTDRIGYNRISRSVDNRISRSVPSE
ncbi:hypothetical protein QYF36_026736 [Acer negundo]|nr:hypothetical protein QYF36_026736 [Acer negundo]